MSWKEYEIDDEDVAEWLPWDGLILDNVMRNKDDSFLSIIQYDPYLANENIQKQQFLNGWNFWSEKQHRQGEDKCFLIVSWNPDYDRKMSLAKNTLNGKSVPSEKAALYFLQVVKKLQQDMSAVTKTKLLEYQDFLDVLSFSLCLGEQNVEMPEASLFFDVLLTQDLHVDFLENGISINEKKMMVLSLPSIPEMPIMGILYKAFEKLSYRYTQRLLMFGSEEAKKDLEAYTASWCNGRKSLKKDILSNILSELNGYYHASFVFLVDPDEYDNIKKYCQEVLNTLEIPYIFERYNLKDVWWGSLPGLFRANISAPITGFKHMDDLLIRGMEEKEVPLHVSSGSI